MISTTRPRKRREKPPNVKTPVMGLRGGTPKGLEGEEGGASRRRVTRARTATASTPVPVTPSITALGRGDAAATASPVTSATKRSRSSNAAYPRTPRKSKREMDSAVNYVLERLGPEESDSPSASQRRRPRSSKPLFAQTAAVEASRGDKPSRTADKSRVRKDGAGQAKRPGGGIGNGNSVSSGGNSAGGMRTDTGGLTGNSGGGNGGGARDTNSGRRNGKKGDTAAKVVLQSLTDKPRSPRAVSPRGTGSRSPSPRAPSPVPTPIRNSSPIKKSNRSKAPRRSSKSSTGSRLRRKRANYNYHILNELTMSPRRQNTKQRSRAGSQRTPWRAPPTSSKASSARLSRLGSRSSVNSGRRRRCRSSRPTRYRAQTDTYQRLNDYALTTAAGAVAQPERRRAESRTRSPARTSSRSPSNASIMRVRRRKERHERRSSYKSKRSKSRKRKHRRSASRISKSKRSSKARAKARRRSGQRRRRRPRDPTFALENILEFLEPPKADNKVLAKQPPPVVVRPSPPPTPRVSTGRLTPSADFMLPDTATVIHDVLQELQGPNCPHSTQLCSKPCVSAADIREKLASTSCVLGEDTLPSKSRVSSTEIFKSRSMFSAGHRSATEVHPPTSDCSHPVSSTLLLDTLRQMCNTPSRFVMHHRRRVPRSEREWVMGAAQKVGHMGPCQGNLVSSKTPTRLPPGRNLIPQAWLGPKFPAPKSHLKSTRSFSARSNFTGVSPAAIAAATLTAAAPATPGVAYGGGPVSVSPVKLSGVNESERASPAIKYTAPLAPPAPCPPRAAPMLRSPSAPPPNSNPLVSPTPPPTPPSTPPAPKVSGHQLGSSGVRPLMRALSAHACSPLRRVPSGPEVRRTPTDVVSALNLSPCSSSTSSRYRRRRRRRRIIGARPTPRDPVSAVQLFAQPPHPLWPPMAAVRRKGTPKHPLSTSSLATNTTATAISATGTLTPNDSGGEARPLRSCLKSVTRPLCESTPPCAEGQECQFGGVGEGSEVPVESPYSRFKDG